MRKFLVLLCVVIMILGGVGCKKSSSNSSSNSSGLVAISDNDQTPASVPEPATILLLGSGLIGLAGFRRKKLFKE